MGRSSNGYSLLPIAIPTANSASARVLRTRLAPLAAMCLCVIIYCMANITKLPFLPSNDVFLDPNETWDAAFSTSREGWIPIGQRISPPPESIGPATSSAELFSEACADRWVASGELCGEVEAELRQREAVDVLYTYTNGTDRLLRVWRESLLSQKKKQQWEKVDGTRGGRLPGGSRLRIAPMDGLNHFRCVTRSQG